MQPLDRNLRLERNLGALRERITRAAARSGRGADDVRLVAVTKSVDVETIRLLRELGLRDFGENRVQQLARRAEALGADVSGFESARDPQAPRWHMIGHLQRNKVKPLLGQCRIVHSVDSARLANEIEARMESLARDQRDHADVLLEVNLSREEHKSGAPQCEAPQLAEQISALPRIRLCGLMTMASLAGDSRAVRGVFAGLRELLERLRSSGAVDENCRELSMGMSNDYTVAVEEGATIVRVGSALFAGLESTNSHA